MSVKAFGVTAENPLLDLPDSASTYLFVRSDNAADTTQTLTIHGTVSAAYDTEAFALAGRIEVKGSDDFTDILHAALSAVCTGEVSCYDSTGSAASGSVFHTSNPAHNETVTVGPTGFTRTYTYSTPEVSTVDFTGITAASLDGTKLVLQDNGGSVRVWFDVDNNGTADPGGAETRALEITSIITGDSASTQATAFAAALTADGKWKASASGNVVTIYDRFFGARTDIDAGTSGLTVAKTADGTADGANLILIGLTSSDTAANLKAAINIDGTAGKEYGTGTTIHAYISASVSGQSVTITDKVACDRQVGWTLTQSASSLSLTSPIGGLDGTLLFTITAGDTSASDDQDLDNEELTSGDSNLLAGQTFVSDPLHLNGKRASIYYGAHGSGADDVTVNYEISTDGGDTWRSGQTAMSNIGHQTSGPRVINCAENAIEHIRLTLNNGANTVALRALAKVVYG